MFGDEEIDSSCKCDIQLMLSKISIFYAHYIDGPVIAPEILE